jgi:hypothetical protein
MITMSIPKHKYANFHVIKNANAPINFTKGQIIDPFPSCSASIGIAAFSGGGLDCRYTA